MTKPTAVRKIGVEITPEQKQQLERYLEWGDLSKIFRFIVEELLNLFERYGYGQVMGALLARKVELKDVLKLKLEPKNGNDK